MFQGGPVQLDSALGLVAVPGGVQEPTGVRRLFGTVALVDLDTPPTLVVPEVAGLRIFAGYAGWSPGQLEDEIATGSWFVADTEGDDVFTGDPDALWRDVLRRQPEPVRWVAWFPPDPALN
jgi:putative transcriptional regulator